jgi:hypothetical protein
MNAQLTCSFFLAPRVFLSRYAKALFSAAGFEDARVQHIAAPFRAPAVDDYIAFLRTSASPLIEVLAPLPEAIQHAAWSEIRMEFEQFATAQGWVGPNALLLCSGRRAARDV